MLMNNRPSTPDGTGTFVAAQTAKPYEINTGVQTGRRYPRDLNPPAFIHPSSEPLKASMEKQEQLKKEIRLLLNLAISNLNPPSASSESKKADDRSLENGLSYIGLTLELAERRIAEIWAMYEGSKEIATVNYPEDYSLMSENDRNDMAKELDSLMTKIPSVTYQKEMAKRLADTMLSRHVPSDTLDKIFAEIDKAPNMSSDPKTIQIDVQEGLVSTVLASKLRGYPDGEAEKAKVEHAERLARIQEAQSKNNDNKNSDNPAARGLKDLADNTKGGAEEKVDSKDTTLDHTVTTKVRGEGK